MLSDLSAFADVAEARSFTRAAAKLGITPSAVTHIVQKVEADLGVILLTRSPRNVVLTSAGEELLATLRPALDDIERTLEAVSKAAPPSG